jgi:alpha-1,2-mannosyltransferase
VARTELVVRVLEPAVSSEDPRSRSRLLPLGIVALSLSLAAYAAEVLRQPLGRMTPMLDLRVYRGGGLVVLHHPADLYSWQLNPAMKFTYTPFAAAVFAAPALLSLTTLRWLMWTGSLLALAIAIWLTLGRLGYARDRLRVGATLVLIAAVCWTQPVQRTLQLGQVDLLLMTLVSWDLWQPEERGWAGVGVGIAAGIKLVPLIFIPYLAITGRLRQAAVAAGSFAATIAIGFAVLPGESARWWLGGLFLDSGRTGFVGDLENQSLRGVITRFAGSVAAGFPAWLAAAALVTVLGLACAATLHKSGRPVEGLLACALTGLLVSPISWDHHWVWIGPGLAVLAHHAARAAGPRRWAASGLAAAVLAVFGAWPNFWAAHRVLVPQGLIWYAPASHFAIGDHPWFAEYHWHRLQLLGGNLYIVVGLMLLALMRALRAEHVPRPASRTPSAEREAPAATCHGRRLAGHDHDQNRGADACCG